MAIVSFQNSSQRFEPMNPSGFLYFEQGGEMQQVTGTSAYSPDYTVAANYVKLGCYGQAMAKDGSMNAPIDNTSAQWKINGKPVTSDNKQGYNIDFEDNGRVIVLMQNIDPTEPMAIHGTAVFIDPRDGHTMTFDCGTKNLYSIQLAGEPTVKMEVARQKIDYDPFSDDMLVWEYCMANSGEQRVWDWLNQTFAQGIIDKAGCENYLNAHKEEESFTNDSNYFQLNDVSIYEGGEVCAANDWSIIVKKGNQILYDDTQGGIVGGIELLSSDIIGTTVLQGVVDSGSAKILLLDLRLQPWGTKTILTVEGRLNSWDANHTTMCGQIELSRRLIHGTYTTVWGYNNYLGDFSPAAEAMVAKSVTHYNGEIVPFPEINLNIRLWAFRASDQYGGDGYASSLPADRYNDAVNGTLDYRPHVIGPSGVINLVAINLDKTTANRGQLGWVAKSELRPESGFALYGEGYVLLDSQGCPILI